jgi:hypothetical protein
MFLLWAVFHASLQSFEARGTYGAASSTDKSSAEGPTKEEDQGTMTLVEFDVIYAGIGESVRIGMRILLQPCSLSLNPQALGTTSNPVLES